MDSIIIFQKMRLREHSANTRKNPRLHVHMNHDTDLTNLDDVLTLFDFLKSLLNITFKIDRLTSEKDM